MGRAKATQDLISFLRDKADEVRGHVSNNSFLSRYIGGITVPHIPCNTPDHISITLKERLKSMGEHNKLQLLVGQISDDIGFDARAYYFTGSECYEYADAIRSFGEDFYKNMGFCLMIRD